MLAATDMTTSPCPHERLRRNARVALDIDAVLCDLIGSCRHTCADYLGIPVSELTFGGDYFVPYAHAARPELIESLRPVMYDLWSRDDTILRAQPVAGGLDLATTLADAGRLAGYITRRSPHVDPLTARWLREHGFPLDGVELYHVGGTNDCKSVTARALDAEVLVDDSVHEATSALANGMHVVMVAMPYNREAAAALSAQYGARFFDAADNREALRALVP
jgi:uncharacterized HAD superfamily protein